MWLSRWQRNFLADSSEHVRKEAGSRAGFEEDKDELLMQHERAARRALSNSIPTARPGQVSPQDFHPPCCLATRWRKARRPHDSNEAFIQSHSVAAQSAQIVLVLDVAQRKAGCTHHPKSCRLNRTASQLALSATARCRTCMSSCEH